MGRKHTYDCRYLVWIYSRACCRIFHGACESDSLAIAGWWRVDAGLVAGWAVAFDRDRWSVVNTVSVSRVQRVEKERAAGANPPPLKGKKKKEHSRKKHKPRAVYLFYGRAYT